MPTTRRAFLIALLFTLLFAATSPAASQAASVQASKSDTSTAAPSKLQEQLDAVLASPDAARAQWGVYVLSLDTGKTLYAHDEHKLFMPASNTKLFTLALTLTSLGPQYRFKTTVEATAPPDKHGRVADLWLVGRGDPNLSGRLLPYNAETERQGAPLRMLDELADQIVRGGVRYVDGDIVADDSYFVHQAYGSGWAQDDVLWAYGAPVSALTVNDNVIFLDVLPGEKAGEPALIKIDPFLNYYKIDNRVKTVAAAAGQSRGQARGQEGFPVRRIAIARGPDSRTLEIWGTIPTGDPGAHEQIAIDDPAMFAGMYLRQALLQRGVNFLGRVRAQHRYRWELDDVLKPDPVASQPDTRAVLASHESAPLGEDLQVLAKVSQNLHAEMMLRLVARERRQIGSVAAGLDELKALLTAAGAVPEEYAFYDGSGLSRQNLVSPATVVALLQYMDKQPTADVWHGLLPVAGVDGTLNGRLKQTPAAGRIQAKTGTLSHVSALSGYATTLKGERLVFSIFVNNYNTPTRTAVGLIDRIALALVTASDSPEK